MYNNLTVKSSIKNYTISFNQNLDNIKKLINEPGTLTILDSNVKKLYPQLSTKNNIVIECNENAKTLNGANNVLQTLIEKKTNIKTNKRGDITHTHTKTIFQQVLGQIFNPKAKVVLVFNMYSNHSLFLIRVNVTGGYKFYNVLVFQENKI